MFLLLSLLVVLPAFSQSTDTLEIIRTTGIPSYLSTRFNKQLSTFNLNSRFNFEQSLGDFDIRLIENFNSTFIRSTQKSIRDEQFFSLHNNYRFNDDISIGLGLKSSIFSDNRRIEINQASTNQVFLFSKLVPLNNILLAPFAG